MSYVYKTDFYYGALLSVLINRGLNPYIVDSSDSRKIFKLTTDSGDSQIFTKYVTSPSEGKNGAKTLWNFTMTANELEEINDKLSEGIRMRFAFVCGQKNIKTNNCEVLLLTPDELEKCIDLNKQNEGQRVSIQRIKGAHSLSVYGSKRKRKVNDADNTLKISRDWAKKL